MPENGILLADVSTSKVGEEFDCCGIVTLGTVLREQGYDVSILEASRIDIGAEYRHVDGSWHHYLAETILETKPRMVLFYTLCDNYLDTLRVAEELRLRSPDVRILFGGPQASSTADESMAAFGFIDLICLGEADDTVVDIIRFMDREREGKDIPNLIYREGDAVVKTPRNPRPPDLSRIPWLDYSLVGGPAGDAISMDVGRGCPYNCRFCSTSGFHNHRPRFRSAESIVAEIGRLKDLYGRKRFEFDHDLFTAKRDFVLDFCRLLCESGLEIEWACSARVDTLDEELISAMAASGCFCIFMGVETGSPRMQGIIRKNLDVERVIPIISCLKEHGVDCVVSLIYGFPEETEEDLEMTVGLLVDCVGLGVDLTQLHRLSYFPGTPYYEQERDNLSLRDGRDRVFHDMVDYVLTDWDREIVRRNPGIFPFHYERETPLLKKYDQLTLFDMNQYYILYHFSPRTYTVLMGHYGRDFLRFYRDFMKLVPDMAERAFEAREFINDDYDTYRRAIEAAIGDFLAAVPTTLPDTVIAAAKETFSTERFGEA